MSSLNAKHLRNDESGAVLPMGLLFALFCFGIGYAVFNVAEAVDFREKIQDRADAAAYAAAAVWAERMNDVSHFSAEQFAQLEVVALMDTLQNDMYYECYQPDPSFAGCDNADKPTGEPINLADGYPAVWQNLGYRMVEYQKILEIPQGIGVTALCADASCSVERTDAIGRAVQPSMYSENLARTIDNKGWPLADSAVATVNSTAGTINHAAGTYEINVRVDKNSHQSPNGNKTFANQGSTAKDAYDLIRCMDDGDVDWTYMQGSVTAIRNRLSRLVTEYRNTVQGKLVEQSEAAAASATAAAATAATAAANPTYNDGDNVPAPVAGDLTLSCAPIGGRCNASIREPNGNVVTVGPVENVPAGLKSAVPPVGISRGTSLGDAAQDDVEVKGVAATAPPPTPPKGVWVLRLPSDGTIESALRRSWKDMRDNHNVCFPTMSRNTNRYRFLGVATVGGGISDANQIFLRNAEVVGIAAGADTEVGRAPENFSRAGSFAWAQAGIGLNIDPEVFASSYSSNNDYYKIPVHAFGLRNWRPRMVRIEFHKGDEGKYGSSNWGGGNNVPGGNGYEFEVWKKVNDAFAH